MAAKSVIAGEYILQIAENGHVDVVRIFRNAKKTMKEIAASKNFPVDEKWNTQDLGRHLVKEFGDGKSVKFDDITINKQASGKIEIFQECKNTKEALRTISEQLGFEYDSEWNTQTFGAKLEKYLTEHKEVADKILQTPNSKKENTQDGPKGPYDDFVKILNESSNLIYVPTDEINEDGITLEYPNSDDPQEALDQVYSPFMDVENGDIECAENVQSVCLSKDGLYCDVDSDIALAVLGGEIITAINRSTAIMVVGDITYSCEDGEFTALDSQREDIEQLEDVASDGSNFLLIDKLRDDIIIEDDDNVYYDAENDDEDSIDEFFRILEELSAEDEMEKIRNLEFANEQELVDYLDNDPDDIDLAYKLICAAYMKWYGYTEDDEFYVDCTTYYFNDNKDFHYERETDIDFG